MKVEILAIILFVVVAYAAPNPAYTLYKFSPAEASTYGSRCLDGSPSGFYYKNYSISASRTKWLVQLVGGGFCAPNATRTDGVDDCYARAKTNLGSSNNWGQNSGYNPPDFASTWNIAVVPYCGGDFHSGTRMQPVVGLYYAGHNTVAAVIQKLKAAYGLTQATEFILSGGSAGGMGVFINIDYVAAQFTASTKVGALPNAGWFINYPQYDPVHDPRNRSAMADRLTTAADSYVNQKCGSYYGTSKAVCISAQVSWPFIAPLNIPFFIANSMFDTNQLNALIVDFSNYDFSNKNKNQYVVNFGSTLRSSAITAATSLNGMFLTSALVHGVDFNQTINGTSLQDTLTAWYSRTTGRQVIDTCTTPNCANIPLP